jgi:biopolymer transport protein ExbD
MIRRRRPLVTPSPRRSAQEPIVPMINVVFLLLIFFLMTAQIVPPDPFDITLPTATGNISEDAQPLYLSKTGEIAYTTLRGAAALTAAAQTTPLDLHTDAELDAATLARTLTTLRNLGAKDIRLISTRGAP